jgi:NitT/TauT family transport system substrate-binding protein
VLQTNGFAIIALDDSGIASPKDLVGKRVAVQPGTAQTTLLEAILASNQIDKTKVNVVNIDPGAFVGALLEKKVDAILGGADFHSVQIRERGFKVRDIFYRDVGVPTVGLSIIARDDKIKAEAALYKSFVEASLLGWDAARKNPDAAADAVVAQFPSVKKAQVLAQFDVVNKLLCAPGATSLGTVPEANWAKSFDLLTQYLGLPKDKPITDYYTEELLPASAPACP